MERYGILARFINHPIPAGEPAPKRFHPVFRDREELPASASLGETIKQALQNSRYLIIICSPHAAKSQWVDKEIATFRAMGCQDRILAFIVDGEPGSADDNECFPPTLKQLEPIAADARAHADGKTNAKLKLLAGMLGVSFDALKQRDNHRRIRRLQLFLGVALALLIGFAALARYANDQKNQAVKARLQAEDVLDYLLFDIRDDLQALGRLDLVDKMQKKVDEYYQNLGTRQSIPRTLHNRAASTNEGDLALARGDLPQALNAFQKALAIVEKLAAADPSNTGWQRDLSINHEKFGDVFRARGDLNQALNAFQKSLAIREKLTATDPSNTVWQHDLSVSYNKLGEVFSSRSDLYQALNAFQKALAIREKLTAADPSNTVWQRDLYISFWNLAKNAKQKGDAYATQWWRKAYDTLNGIKESGKHISPEDEKDLEILQQKVGQ